MQNPSGNGKPLCPKSDRLNCRTIFEKGDAGKQVRLTRIKSSLSISNRPAPQVAIATNATSATSV